MTGHGDSTVRLRLMKGLTTVMAGSNLLFRPIHTVDGRNLAPPGMYETL